MNKKYFVEIGQEQIKVKDWARSNQEQFPDCSFTNSQDATPTTHFIARRLEEIGFNRNESENIVAYRN